MIKALIQAEKKDTNEQVRILLLGFSFQNLELLRQKRPIKISEMELSDMSLEGMEILIFADETEEKIQHEIEKRFTIDNRVTRQ